MKKSILHFAVCSFLITVWLSQFTFAMPPLIYWTDEANDTINRANYDGSDITTIVTRLRAEPRAITISPDFENIYWSEWRNRTIMKADIDGSGVSTVINVGGEGTSGFDIDYNSSQIYWAENTGGFSDKIKRANLSGAGQTTLIQFGSGGAVDIALDTASGKMYWTIPTAYGDYIQRSNLNGSNVETVLSVGRNPWDIELDLVGGVMYWTEYGSGKISKANLDGTGRQTLISGLDNPYGLALDLRAGLMFWADAGTGKIQRSNLDGTQMLDVISGLNSPWGVAINPGPEPTTVVDVDIKPGSCPNPLNVKSSGVLPVAILGTDDYDVTTIDPTSIRLTGVEPLRSGYEDVATPVSDTNDCNCITDGPDGLLDLTLKFKTQRIVEAIGDVNDGDVLELELTGVLFDETPIEGADCILIKGKHKAHNKADINKDGVVNMTDFTLMTENWLQSSIVQD